MATEVYEEEGYVVYEKGKDGASKGMGIRRYPGNKNSCPIVYPMLQAKFIVAQLHAKGDYKAEYMTVKEAKERKLV